MKQRVLNVMVFGALAIIFWQLSDHAATGVDKNVSSFLAGISVGLAILGNFVKLWPLPLLRRKTAE